MNPLLLIKETASLNTALVQLDKAHSKSMTLFVVNHSDQMVGTLTDGDIRRALIEGVSLSEPVSSAMYPDFSFLPDKNDIASLRAFRNKGIELIPLLDKDRKIIEIIDLSYYKSSLPIDAVLMAGGKGERLRPYTQDTPKPLLKIGDKAIIDRNIDRLIEYGIKHISVTVNYLKEQLIDYYTEPKPSGVKVQCVSEKEFFGTIGALTLIEEFYNDTILVMNSDLLTDIDYEDFFMHFQEHNTMMSVAAIPYTISVPYGILNLEGRNIKGVYEKPIYNHYANAGIYLIKKEALQNIPENKIFNATDLIETLITKNQKVIRYPLTKLWIDIGTPEEYHRAQELIKHINQ